jgi:hypothetical protein
MKQMGGIFIMKLVNLQKIIGSVLRLSIAILLVLASLSASPRFALAAPTLGVKAVVGLPGCEHRPVRGQ